MKIASARLNPHPPPVMVHLLQVNVSAGRNNFVKGGPSILKLPLEPYFNRTGVVLRIPRDADQRSELMPITIPK